MTNNDHEMQRRKLWADVYLAWAANLRSAGICLEHADSALAAFDARFKALASTQDEWHLLSECVPPELEKVDVLRNDKPYLYGVRYGVSGDGLERPLWLIDVERDCSRTRCVNENDKWRLSKVDNND